MLKFDLKVSEKMFKFIKSPPPPPKIKKSGFIYMQAYIYEFWMKPLHMNVS